MFYCMHNHLYIYLVPFSWGFNLISLTLYLESVTLACIYIRKLKMGAGALGWHSISLSGTTAFYPELNNNIQADTDIVLMSV